MAKLMWAKIEICFWKSGKHCGKGDNAASGRMIMCPCKDEVLYIYNTNYDNATRLPVIDIMIFTPKTMQKNNDNALL